MTPLRVVSGFLVTRYLAVSVALLLVIAAAGLALTGLSFDSDINRVFLTDSDRSQAQRDFDRRFEDGSSDVAFLVEADGALTATQLKALRDLALDLELTVGVRSVASPFSLRFPPRHMVYPDAPLFANEIDPKETGARVAAFRGIGTGLPLLLTETSLLIVARIDTSRTSLTDFLREADQLTFPLEASGLTTSVTGEDVISLSIAEGLKSDLFKLNFLGIVIVGICALLFLRDARAALVAVLPALACALVALSLAPTLGYPLTVINNVIPVLILILGVANGLHLTMHLRALDGATDSAIANTIEVVGPAVLLTALTTAVSFASILFNPNPQLFEFAALGTLSMIVTMFVLLPCFAVLARVLRPRGRKGTPLTSVFASRLGRASMRHPKATVASGSLLLVVSAVAFVFLSPWFPLYENLPSGSRLVATNDRIADEFGGVFTIWVEMPELADWPSLERSVAAVEREADGATVLSEIALARWAGNEGTPPAHEILNKLPSDVVARLRDAETNRLRFSVSVPEPMRTEKTRDAFDRIEDAALSSGAERVFGLPAIMRHEALNLIGDLSWSMVVACIAGAAVLAAWFRSLILLPVALAVNVLPVLVVGAALHILNRGLLTPPAVLSLTIAFGVAIDDTVHFISRYKHALRSGFGHREACDISLISAGGVMILTSVLLCAGLAITLISDFQPVRLFGSMMILTLFLAILADLVLLPTLLSMTEHSDAN